MQTSLPDTVALNELMALSVPEKLALIGALWDSIDKAAPNPAMPDWQKAELDRREAAEQIAPEPVFSWDEAKQQVKTSHAQPRSP